MIFIIKFVKYKTFCDIKLYLFYTNNVTCKIHNNTISAYKFNCLNLFILIDLVLNRVYNLS